MSIAWRFSMDAAFQLGKASSLALIREMMFLPDVGQRHQTAGSGVAAFAVLDLLGRVEVITATMMGFSSKVRLPSRFL